MPLLIIGAIAALAAGGWFFDEASQAAQSTTQLAGTLTTLVAIGGAVYLAVEYRK